VSKATNIHHFLQEAKAQGKKLFALLIDPDSIDNGQLINTVQRAEKARVDLLLIGGSLLTKDALEGCLDLIKQNCQIPTVLFPGSILQMSEKADALLLLSLISGRNPDLLIGNQVVAAPYLKKMDLELLATGYMLVDSGRATTASYMSNSQPIPHHKAEIAACTAMAGEMLGLKLIYLDGGSGAIKPVSEAMISAVRKAVDLPIIVGGGINSPEKIIANCQAGADLIVVGNAVEKDPSLIQSLADATRSFQQS
jgi:putative glycerol-1-phosphate prenyltransferase